MVCVGLLAGGAAWESRALALLEATSGLTVLKRWVDVDDLMGSVTTGQFDVAIVAAEVSGLDTSAVAHMTRHGCAAVGVIDGGHPELVPQRLERAGVVHVLEAADIEGLPEKVRDVARLGQEASEAGDAASAEAAVSGAWASGDTDETQLERGRVIVVWGAVGAPGRTTVATGLAGLLADRGRATIIVDGDRHASVAQHLGVMDQVSGLLSATRLRASGSLAGRVHGSCRALTPMLGVMTGVPRPDRRDEVAAGALSEVLEEISTFADVVVDLGHDLDSDVPPGTSGSWNMELIEAADEVVVVGAADPVGLTRLAHALVELADVCGDVGARVVVNRTRPTLGWSEKEIAVVIGRFAPVSALHFLPEDRVAADRALVAGEPVTHRNSALGTALGSVLDALVPETVASTPRSTRKRPQFLKPLTERRGAERRGAERRGAGGVSVPGPRSPAAQEELTLRTTGTSHRQ